MDWTELLREDPSLAARESHADALTRAATRRLRAGRFADAATLLRRRTRLPQLSAPAERALLALAAALAGDRERAAEALGDALAADSLDPTVALVALRLATSPAEARGAAERILAGPASADETLAKALLTLFAAGDGAATRLDALNGCLSGWIAWTGTPLPTLVLEDRRGETRHPLAPAPDLRFLPAGASGAFVSLPFLGDAPGYRIECEGVCLLAGAVAARVARRPTSAAGDGTRAPLAVPERRSLRVVLPVYGDAEATAEALDAAIREVARYPGAELVVVDDASPDPTIRELLDAVAARGFAELRRNLRNLGFTGAVARGLEGAGGRDALILNSDAVLPPGALARLTDAAYAAPDIGTATPLGNNGEWTSWPRLGMAAPSPEPADRQRLDDAARRIGGTPVDLPNGVGFALFVRHDALAAAGTLSAVYERGYFEDLEWTLQMRRAGFRNVAATGVFVTHHGSRSFGPRKALLVARNLRRFRRRFPDLQAESAAFRRADPLRPVRSRLEAACPPEDAPLLLVAQAGSALASERLHRHRTENRAVVTLLWRQVGDAVRAELRRSDGAAPQSLGFDAEREAEPLARWLAALAPCFVELAGAPPPGALGRAIVGLDAAFVILAGDPPRVPAGAAPLLAGFEGWRRCLGERWLQVVASDRGTLAALDRHLAGDPDAGRVEAALPALVAREPPAGGGLGVLMGVASPATLRWTMRLAAVVRQRSAAVRVSVLGASADDGALLGQGVGVSGPLRPAEFAAAATEAGVGAIVLPPADPSLALLDRVLAETGCPGARLDWSEGTDRADPPFLLLERSRGEPDAFHAVHDWFAGRFAP